MTCFVAHFNVEPREIATAVFTATSETETASFSAEAKTDIAKVDFESECSLKFSFSD